MRHVTGLVFTAAAGHNSTFHKHIPGTDVHKTADVASMDRQRHLALASRITHHWSADLSTLLKLSCEDKLFIGRGQVIIINNIIIIIIH